MRQTLKKALVINFGHEGGYVNAKTDRGGPTKYGITIATLGRFLGRPATIDEVKNLTLAAAEEIYRRFYWPMAGCDQAPAGLDYALFNTAVMSGPSRAVKLLQLVLAKRGVYDGGIDGHYGVGTQQGVDRYGSTKELIVDFVMRHLEYCRGIKGKQGWASNGRGWEYRLTGKDPKGIFKNQPGVIGYALQIHDDWVRTAGDATTVSPKEKIPPMGRPAELEPSMDAPAIPSKPTALDTVLKPESTSSIVTLISTILSATVDSPPLQYAFAAVVVMAGSVAAYQFYKRIRSEEVL
jgi:lysozyme family protein